ncbi:Hsp20/alpha crystallin family protein [Flammeovirga sp. SubArs3]|uniref:Hsp20/alpha crystallin family protein n=1 Tax=Flammeovirga sp. SubArs3 TaxID=2995316 RepID=UPI00248B3605|nr:Hsp20/alpha crystallin family protein [Flammeovirga sp. SubArs3]
MKYSMSDYPSTFISSFMNDVINVLDTVNPTDAHVPMNVKEGVEGYTVEVVIPGIKKEEVSISVEENKLVISHQYLEEDAEGVKFLKREFKGKSFERTFTLPNNIDTENINASYNDGILSVILPKNINVEKKKIDIN